VCRNTSAGNHLSSVPEAEQPLVFVQNLCYATHVMRLPTRLHMCFDRVKWEHYHMLCDPSYRTCNDMFPHRYIRLACLPVHPLIIGMVLNLFFSGFFSGASHIGSLLLCLVILGSSSSCAPNSKRGEYYALRLTLNSALNASADS